MSELIGAIICLLVWIGNLALQYWFEADWERFRKKLINLYHSDGLVAPDRLFQPKPHTGGKVLASVGVVFFLLRIFFLIRK